MTTETPITDIEFNQIRSLIEKECGIIVDEQKVYLIESRLKKILIEFDCKSFSDLYRKASDKSNLSLREKIIDAMTTNETLWFRDKGLFRFLDELIIPELVQRSEKAPDRPIRIWSAACSTGQEPYSIAIAIQEYCRKHPSAQKRLQSLEILATDISPTVLALAESGRYNDISMSRGMPEELRQRYFSTKDQFCLLNEEIRNMVTFRKLNLCDSFSMLGPFDVIFLRYVAIYFSAAFKAELLSKIHRQLRPNGFLLMGATESVKGYSDNYKVMDYHGYPYYQPEEK